MLVVVDGKHEGRRAGPHALGAFHALLLLPLVFLVPFVVVLQHGGDVGVVAVRRVDQHVGGVVELEVALRTPRHPVDVSVVEGVGVLGVNSIALLKSQQTFRQTFQQTFQQSFYSSVGHPVVLKTLLKSLLKRLLRFQQSY